MSHHLASGVIFINKCKTFPDRQRTAQLEQSISTEKSTESNQQTDRRPSTTKEDGDEFPAGPNVSTVITVSSLTPISTTRVLQPRYTETKENCVRN